MTSGKFITLEGGEGTGKSTQAALLSERLRQAGIDAFSTREPGGAPGAEEIRALLVDGALGRWDATAEALLHFAARRDHLVQTVWPALERGRWVVSDRFADSTMAYQGCGLGLGRETIEALYRIAVGDFAPDLTVILDLPPEAGLLRAAGRAGAVQRYERMAAEFHARLRACFLDIARREPKRCVVVDAAAPVGEVEKAIAAAVQERLGVTLA